MVQVEQQSHEGDRQDILCMEQCYGSVSFMRSKPNGLLFYVSNFLSMFFVLGSSFVFCGKTGKVVILPIVILETRTALVN